MGGDGLRLPKHPTHPSRALATFVRLVSVMLFLGLVYCVVQMEQRWVRIENLVVEFTLLSELAGLMSGMVGMLFWI